MDSIEKKKEGTAEDWEKFRSFFAGLIILSFITKYLGRSVTDQGIAILLLVVELARICAMVGLIGYWSYKFSGKKLYSLLGIWGLLGIGYIGPIIGYYAVKNIYHKFTNQKWLLKEKLIAILFLVYAAGLIPFLMMPLWLAFGS